MYIRRNQYNEKVYNFPMRRIYPIFQRSFKTLNDFANALKYQLKRKTNVSLNAARRLKCEIIANAMFQHKVEALNTHLFHDYRPISTTIWKPHKCTSNLCHSDRIFMAWLEYDQRTVGTNAWDGSLQRRASKTQHDKVCLASKSHHRRRTEELSLQCHSIWVHGLLWIIVQRNQFGWWWHIQNEGNRSNELSQIEIFTVIPVDDRRRRTRYRLRSIIATSFHDVWLHMLRGEREIPPAIILPVTDFHVFLWDYQEMIF